MIEQTTINRRYRVERLVGEGGMAVVFRGHDLLLGRDVAIKALRPQFAADPAFRARFEREAQAAAGFSHPHIIDIFDVGEEDGTPYIVMEFVRGQTLKEIIDAEGPFHPDDVGALLEQVGAALDYAHERGYVHRDVKPQNILVDERGIAKVVDFGIAKGLADSDLTEADGRLGTVGYLAPEQASGLMATPASDVYAAGVVAFEMLTGRLPFAAETPVAVAMRHVHDAPPRPSEFAPNLPRAVDAIVLRALAKDPTKRYPSAGALARAMTDWRHALPAEPPPPIRLPVPAGATRPPSPTPTTATAQVAVPPARRASPPLPVEVEWTPGGRVPPPPSTSDRTRTASPVAAPRAVPEPAHRDEVGCVTWIVGTAILAALIALIWLGFRLSPRLEGLGSDPAPTPTPVPVLEMAPSPAAPSETASTAAVPIAPAPATGTTAPGMAPEPTGRAAAEPAIGQPAALVPVPDLFGLPRADAERAANNRGLLLEVAREVASDSVPAGAVAAQAPRAGAQAAQGSRVRVDLSTGSGRVDLAALDLAGRDPAEAETLLAERGLGVVREEVASRDVPAGRVVGIDPAAAAPGATVTLLVSAGDRVRIPGEIQGQPVEQVEAQLAGLGLRMGERLPVDRGTIEAAGLDLALAGIVPGDVVGVEGDEVNLDAWVAPGTVVDLVYYDRALDAT